MRSAHHPQVEEDEREDEDADDEQDGREPSAGTRTVATRRCRRAFDPNVLRLRSVPLALVGESFRILGRALVGRRSVWRIAVEEGSRRELLGAGTISKRTTVMLSSPPRAFAALTSDSAACSGSLPAAATISAISSSASMTERPSEQRR